MKTPLLALFALGAAAPALPAQVKAILFTGRFPFVSLDPATTGGSIVEMSEFDFSYCAPFVGSQVGHTLMPATGMQCYIADADADGDYLAFEGWKPSYFTSAGIAGLFVKHGLSSLDWQDVYWTPDLDPNNAPSMAVMTNNGTMVSLAEGDFVRFGPNGNCEFFLTQAQLAVAAGPQVNGDVPAALGLVQAANGDLYYTPHDGGHWVSGNSTGQVFCFDGAICKIDAANITYDAQGNVAALAPASARLLANETLGLLPNVRDMVENAGSYDRTGSPIVTAGVYGRTGGLGLDPNGGTWIPPYPDASGAFPPEPNLCFSSTAGSYGGTIWTTAFNGTSQGDVLELNAFGGPGTGVLCGSKTPGVAADGSWLGVQLDVANFQPTLFGMTIVEMPPQQLIADMDGLGKLADNTTQPTWTTDYYTVPGTPIFHLIDLGPQPPVTTVPSIATTLAPLPWAPDTWQDLILTPSFVPLGLAVTDASGYATVSVGNPNNGGFPGFTFAVQGVGLNAAGEFQLSSPIVVQL